MKANASHKAGTTSAGTVIRTDLSDVQKVVAAKAYLESTSLPNFVATNATSADEILTMINAAISETGVNATWMIPSDYTKILATEEAAGSISGTIQLRKGSGSDTVDVYLNIAKIGSDAEKVASAKNAVNNGLNTYTVTNATSESILSFAQEMVNNEGITGVTTNWKAGSPTIILATTEAAGSVTGTLVFTCGSESVELVVNKIINQLTPEYSYEVIEGANANWVNDSTSNLSFKVDGDYDKFIDVKIDGNLVAKNNYTATKGSTIITLSADYLKTLRIGQHELKVLFNGHEVNSNFTISQPSGVNPPEEVTPEPIYYGTTPNTGDTTNNNLLMGLLVASGCLMGLLGYRRKKSLNK